MKRFRSGDVISNQYEEIHLLLVSLVCLVIPVVMK